MKTTLLPPLLGIMAMATLFGCGTKDTVLYESGPIDLSAEAPLYEGTNTAQGIWDPNIEAFLVEQGLTMKQLSGARVVKASLSMPEDQMPQGLRSVSVMLASDAQDMEQVAVLNPFPEGRTSAELIVANEQKGLLAHLKERTVIVVADLDLAEDSEEDRHVIGNFTIELTIDR